MVSSVPVSGFVILSLIFGLALFKLVLILSWTRRLHKVHGARYGYSIIFRMMFSLQSSGDMDSSLWKDFEPIQRLNYLSNIIIPTCVIMAMIFFIVSKRLG